MRTNAPSARAVATLLLFLAPRPAAVGGVAADPAGELAGALATITEKEIDAHLVQLASPELEGRDSPSAGLTRAGDYVARLFEEAGLRGAGPEGAFRLPFTRELPAPVVDKCKLAFEVEGAEPVQLELGKDFVPLPGCDGAAQGQLVFVGFGISAKKERYDDLKGAKLKDKVALLLEGEPRHKRLFEGPEVTAFADVRLKLEALVEEGVAGALVVRREVEREKPPSVALEPPALGFRYTWAQWNPSTTEPLPDAERSFAIPVLEVSAAVASRMLGQDVIELAQKIDRGGRPLQAEPAQTTWITLSSDVAPRMVSIDNIVGILPGSDPALADEYVVIGAHYDHIGVDPLGRIGCGADDNASGTALLIELVQALAQSPPRRSILACAFAAEEDGLVGSRELCRAPPVPKTALVAMLNFDMVGRGDDGEVVVIGTDENPGFEELLERAKRLEKSGIKKVTTGVAHDLWQRSDHYAFHEIGVPSLFFFEAANEDDNVDYHTFRDTIDDLSGAKITNTARFAFSTTWLLADADDRPPPPR